MSTTVTTTPAAISTASIVRRRTTTASFTGAGGETADGGTSTDVPPSPSISFTGSSLVGGATLRHLRSLRPYEFGRSSRSGQKSRPTPASPTPTGLDVRRRPPDALVDDVESRPLMSSARCARSGAWATRARETTADRGVEHVLHPLDLGRSALDDDAPRSPARRRSRRSRTPRRDRARRPSLVPSAVRNTTVPWSTTKLIGKMSG